MTTVKQIFDLIQQKALFEIQMSFDNAGFLVGRSNTKVSSVLVALDITEAVIYEAIELGAKLIVAHHPVIWGGAKSVTDMDPTGKKLLLMIENGIAAVCAHTNLDSVEDGVNDALADKLGLTNVMHLHQDGEDALGRPYGIGRTGFVQRQSLIAFVSHVKETLGSNGVRYVDAGKPVQNVAVGGGSCGNMLGDALKMGCDTFVTADVKYDTFLDAKALGINLVDAGHFPTENVICPSIQKWIQDAFPELDVMISEKHKEVYSCL